jgi:hypothetical protein
MRRPSNAHAPPIRPMSRSLRLFRTSEIIYHTLYASVKQKDRFEARGGPKAMTVFGRGVFHVIHAHYQDLTVTMIRCELPLC